MILNIFKFKFIPFGHFIPGIIEGIQYFLGVEKIGVGKVKVSRKIDSVTV